MGLPAHCPLSPLAGRSPMARLGGALACCEYWALTCGAFALATVFALTTLALEPHVSLISAASAEQPHTRIAEEYALKGAFLLNFAKFTSWPETQRRLHNDFFSICTWKDAPLAALEPVYARKTVFNLPIRTFVIDAPQEIEKCDILFMTAVRSADFATVSAAAKAASTLIVTEFSSSGMVNFILGEDGQVRFECNLAAAKQANISFSSQLISLAVRVYGEKDL